MDTITKRPRGRPPKNIDPELRKQYDESPYMKNYKKKTNSTLGRPKKYDEDHYKEYQQQYHKEKITCDICQCSFGKSYKNHHEQSKKHVFIKQLKSSYST